MRQEIHDRSFASLSGDADVIKPETGSGETSRLMRQVAIGASLFVVGVLVGAILASLPIRGRAPAGGLFWSDFLRLLGIGSLTWIACLLSSPLYIWLARRYPIFQRHWPRNLALHILVTAGLVLLTGVVYYQLLLRQARNIPALPARTAQTETTTNTPNLRSQGAESRRPAPGGGFRLPGLGSFLFFRFLTESLPFWAMIALIHAFELQRRNRQREVEAARLQAQLTESRLEALTAQLHPHFLFNTLQGVSTLMRRDVDAADAMLSRLSDLLRETLQRGDRPEVPLNEELDTLDHYVAISRERFKDRLIFETEISADARCALVPFFILQPLVENALQHGIARRAGVGRVSVNAQRQDDALFLNVADDGPGLGKEEREFPREGIGLSNTRQRLRQLYGDDQSLRLRTPAEGGLRVEVIIPYRRAPEVKLEVVKE